jgi:energy-coupling factor transporter ATP-binding protein EcfA2
LNGILGRERSGVMSGTISINGRVADSLTASELSLLIGSVLQNADEQIINL